MSEKAAYFNEREHQMICLVARMIEDAQVLTMYIQYIYTIDAQRQN